MKEQTLWDKILYALRYNDSIWHNIFLTIILIVGSIFLLILFIRIIQGITRAKSQENQFKKTFKFIFLTTGFWLFIFPLGLYLLINVTLTDSSDTAAINKAFLYEYNGKPAASFIINKFVANETDSGITSGSTFYKIQGVDLESGKLLFDKKIKELKGTVREPKIICTSKDNLFVLYDSKILVLEKNSGKTVQFIKSVPGLKDVLLMQDPEMCKYDKSSQSIVFKANNGLVYSLDTEKLNISENKSIDIENYFGNKVRESSPDYLSKGISICKTPQKNSYYMFLTDSDINNITKGKEISSSADNTERRYLYKGKMENLNELRKLCSDVFLSGGFLYNEISNDKYFYSEMEPQNKNFHDYVNISTRGIAKALEPFKVDGSDLSFIVHKKSIEHGSDVLLTAIDVKEEKIRWTIDTYASEIKSCYSIDKDHILLLCQHKFESMGSNASTGFILYISLTDGKATGHEFKYGRSFEIDTSTTKVRE